MFLNDMVIHQLDRKWGVPNEPISISSSSSSSSSGSGRGSRSGSRSRSSSNYNTYNKKIEQRFNKVCTKPNLYSSGIKLIKLVYTPLNVSFLKTLATNLSFSRNILDSRKKSDPFISVSIENFMFLRFLFIYSRKIVHVLVY